jgi:hypothetical protein
MALSTAAACGKQRCQESLMTQIICRKKTPDTFVLPILFAYDKATLRGIDLLEEQRHILQFRRGMQFNMSRNGLELDAKRYLLNLYRDAMDAKTIGILEEQIWRIKNGGY